MANICEYKVIVKGKKNACYAFLGSMSALDEKCIVEEFGTDSDYTLFFEGSCKWSVDAYCDKVYEGETPITLPEDASEALELGENTYWYHTVQERSKMFDVEVLCNSCDIDEEAYEDFAHYISGKSAGGECPEELLILDPPEDDVIRCISCGDEVYEDSAHFMDEGIYYCDNCYKEIFE